MLNIRSKAVSPRRAEALEFFVELLHPEYSTSTGFMQQHLDLEREQEIVFYAGGADVPSFLSTLALPDALRVTNLAGPAVAAGEPPPHLHPFMSDVTHQVLVEIRDELRGTNGTWGCHVRQTITRIRSSVPRQLCRMSSGPARAAHAYA